MNFGKSSKKVALTNPTNVYSRKLNTQNDDHVTAVKDKFSTNQGETCRTNLKVINERLGYQRKNTSPCKFSAKKMGKVEDDRNSSLKEYFSDFQHFRLRYLPFGIFRIKDTICKKIKVENEQTHVTETTVREIDLNEQIGCEKLRKSPSNKLKSTSTRTLLIDRLRTSSENLHPQIQFSKNWYPEFLTKYFQNKSCICLDKNLATQCKIWRYSAPEKPKINSIGLKCKTNVVDPLKECFEVVQKNRRIMCDRKKLFNDGESRKRTRNENLASSACNYLRSEDCQNKFKIFQKTIADRKCKHRREKEKSSSTKRRHYSRREVKKYIYKGNTKICEDIKKFERQERRNRKKLSYKKYKMNENSVDKKTRGKKKVDQFLSTDERKIETIFDNASKIKYSSRMISGKCSGKNDNRTIVPSERNTLENSGKSDANNEINLPKNDDKILSKNRDECQSLSESDDVWYEVNTKYSDTSENAAVIFDELSTPEELRHEEFFASTALSISDCSFVESRKKESKRISMHAGVPKSQKQLLREKITESEILGDIKRRIDKDFDYSFCAEKEENKKMEGTRKKHFGNNVFDWSERKIDLNPIDALLQSEDVDNPNIKCLSSSSTKDNKNRIFIAEDRCVKSNQLNVKNISLSPIKNDKGNLKLKHVCNAQVNKLLVSDFSTSSLAAGDQGRSKMIKSHRHSLPPFVGEKKFTKITADYYTTMKEFNIEGSSPSPALTYKKKSTFMEDCVKFSKEINTTLSSSTTCFENYGKMKRRSSVMEKRWSRGQKDAKSYLFRRFLSMDILSSSVQDNSRINYKQDEQERFDIDEKILTNEAVENMYVASPSHVMNKIEESELDNENNKTSVIESSSRDSSSKEDIFESADSGVLVVSSQNDFYEQEDLSMKTALDRSFLPICHFRADKSCSDESMNRQVDLAVQKFTDKLMDFERKSRAKMRQIRNRRKLTRMSCKFSRKMEDVSSRNFYASLSTFHFPRISPCSSDDERFIGERTTPSSMSFVSDIHAKTLSSNKLLMSN